MTIVASGPLNLATIAAEFGISHVNAYLGGFYRGNSTKWVRANGSGNIAVNHAAGVPATATNLYIGNFYGEGKGWTYTNGANRANNYYLHGEFGTDWEGANGDGWPMVYVNNATIYSTSTSYWALIFHGRNNHGPCTFINNGEIQAAGGAVNSGAGQHAIYVYNGGTGAAAANRPIVYNYGAIRGGGGGGGKGGTGGKGGNGSAVINDRQPDSGDVYDGNNIWSINNVNNSNSVKFAGGTVSTSIGDSTTSFVSGSYTYYRSGLKSSQQVQTGGFNPDGGGPVYKYIYYYALYRVYTYTASYTGGAGGAGGNGGDGIGWNDPASGGSGGAAGADGPSTAGKGGTGGSGGSGGTWGADGGKGATGATGATGNVTGGSAGAAGAAGGDGGYSIWSDTHWGYGNAGTNNGSYGGGVANS